MPSLPVYVSMTAIGSRLSGLDHVVGTLMRQTLRPTRIILNVSHDKYLIDPGLNFEDLPPLIRSLAVSGVVEVYFTPNTGPYRKLLPTLRRFSDHEFLVATVDDDILYPPRWLEGLYETVAGRRCVGAYRCRAMMIEQGQGQAQFAPYLNWPVFFAHPVDLTRFRPEAQPLMVCPTGRGGVIYHSSFFKDMELLEELQRLAPAQDDLAFKFYTLIAGIPVMPVHFSKAGFPQLEFPGLYPDNGPDSLFGHNQRGLNDATLQRLLDYCTGKKLLDLSRYLLA